MNREYEEAFAEVDEVIKLMPIDLSSKIPLRFRQVISDCKAKDYKIEIKEPIEEQKLKNETIVILGLIYRDFLCTPEEREKLQLKDAEELKKIEQEMQAQYDINKVFKKRKTGTQDEYNDDNETEMIIYKEPGFIKRFFNLIKGIFKKNKF